MEKTKKDTAGVIGVDGVDAADVLQKTGRVAPSTELRKRPRKTYSRQYPTTRWRNETFGWRRRSQFEAGLLRTSSDLF